MVEREDHLDGPTVRRISSERPASVLLPSDAAWSAEAGDKTAVDFVAVQADDLLLDMLRSSDAIDGGLAEPELSALLLSWRRDVDSEAIGGLVDLNTAVATITAAKARRRPRHRLLIPLASAAAVLAIAFTGVGLAARDAQPGDALWGLAKVLYSDHARSVEAAASAREDLDAAMLALKHGNYSAAAAALTRASRTLAAVAPEDGAAALIAQHEILRKQLGTSAPEMTVPTAITTPPIVTTSIEPLPTTPLQSDSKPVTTTTVPPTSTPPPTTSLPPVSTPSSTDSTTGNGGTETAGNTEGSPRSGGNGGTQAPPPVVPPAGG